ncbi:alkaline phosphatase D family protein [Shewanella frigidimarina]|uniref:PhoD-like phosphatase metallophosphatase domain-containing protein n=1 Tax=Shewanella frigidimarina TaxID=56812 RepID=A0A119CZG2_SHEFR|nr:alkaline phosphatase D family protein [Shewanella frigidimarina]KVX01282.1 hypothetical protein AWJ07_18445 [Shewanella frigidimarina]
MERRSFIKLSALATGAILFPTQAARLAANRANDVELTAVESLYAGQSRPWLGLSFWGNRLQDWRLHNARIECIRGDKGFEVRTVSLLTRSLNAKHVPGRIQVKLGNLTPTKSGFAGLLIGAGANKLDYRASAMIHAAAGENGGFMAVINSDGELSFRDFSDQQKPLSFEKVIRSNTVSIGKLHDREIILDCHFDPVSQDKFDVRLVATDAKTNKELGFIVRSAVNTNELIGGLMLLSSPPSKQAGARWYFKDIKTGGDKVAQHPQQQLGPVIGCMHSVNRKVLKLSCQFMPVASEQFQQAKLQYRISPTRVLGSSTEAWVDGQVQSMQDGYVMQFRLTQWNSLVDHEYRIVDEAGETLYQGFVVKDPKVSKDLSIALYSCLMATSEALDKTHYQKRLTQERNIGRFTPENILVPYTQLSQNCEYHQPDLYVFCGDQFYESTPTQVWRNKPDSHLDMLYRWYLWYWSFAKVIRDRPTIMIADDHDVMQGNLWGVGGRDPVVLEGKTRTEEDGGYTQTKSLVNMVYRVQQGHNPDPYDPTPIDNDISVSYCEFVYGGVSFAMVEDRKFKSRRNININPIHTQGELLGHRQENFLREWADIDSDLPKVCLASSMWGSPQTKSNVEPLLDYDANGYPPDGRTRAISLIKNAKAVVICGDQHLAMMATQGINDYEDGPLFFAGPAGAAFWQRWFEGLNKLPNQFNNDPNTGNFIDTFGNKMRVLAVANPKITYDEFKSQTNGSWSNFMADPALKSEGYGIVKVKHSQQKMIFECWEGSVDPAHGQQFAGWPYTHRFPR